MVLAQRALPTAAARETGHALVVPAPVCPACGGGDGEYAGHTQLVVLAL